MPKNQTAKEQEFLARALCFHSGQCPEGTPGWRAYSDGAAQAIAGMAAGQAGAWDGRWVALDEITYRPAGEGLLNPRRCRSDEAKNCRCISWDAAQGIVRH